MMISKYSKFLVACALCFATQAQAGNWLRNEDEKLYTAAFTYTNSDHVWDVNGNGVASCINNKEDLYQAFEYGYSYYYTLIGGMDAQKIDCGQAHEAGVGNFDFGVRGRIFPEQNGKAWEVKLIVPSGYDNTVAYRLGNGQLGLETGLYWGEQFDPYNLDPYRPGYIPFPDTSWEFGTRLHLWTGFPAPQWLTYVKLNKSLPNEWMLGAVLEADTSVNYGTPEPTAAGGLRQPFYDVVLFKAEFKRQIDKGLSFVVTPQVNLMGRNTPQSTGLTIGLNWLMFK